MRGCSGHRLRPGQNVCFPRVCGVAPGRTIGTGRSSFPRVCGVVPDRAPPARNTGQLFPAYAGLLLASDQEHYGFIFPASAGLTRRWTKATTFPAHAGLFRPPTRRVSTATLSPRSRGCSGAYVVGSGVGDIFPAFAGLFQRAWHPNCHACLSPPPAGFIRVTSSHPTTGDVTPTRLLNLHRHR